MAVQASLTSMMKRPPREALFESPQQHGGHGVAMPDQHAVADATLAEVAQDGDDLLKAVEVPDRNADGLYEFVLLLRQVGLGEQRLDLQVELEQFTIDSDAAPGGWTVPVRSAAP